MVAPTSHSFSQKTRLNDLSHNVKIWTNFSSVLSQFTRLTDGRTDGQTNRPNSLARPRLHSMQRGKKHRDWPTQDHI